MSHQLPRSSQGNQYFYLVFLIFCVALLFTYGHTLYAPFYLDDFPNIVFNKSIRLTSLSIYDIIKIFQDNHERQIAFGSFALNYYIAGYNVTSYHILNIVIHFANGLLVFKLFQLTCRFITPVLDERTTNLISFSSALLWLIHPIQIQAVTYIVQRMTSMAVLFYLLSIIAYIRARTSTQRWKSSILYSSCLITGCLALVTKEICLTLPFTLLLYDICFISPRVKIPIKPFIIIISTLIIAFICYSLVKSGFSPIQMIQSPYADRPFTLIERLLTQQRVLIFYLSLLIFPHPSRLNLEHDFQLSTSFLTPLTTLPAFLILATISFIAVLNIRKHPLFAFSTLWFMLHQILESSFIGLEIIFEHRLYLPSIFPIFMVVYFLFKILNKQKSIILICSIICLFSFWTLERNKIWADELLFWEDTVNKSPEKARPHNTLGTFYKNNHDLRKAAYHYTKAISLDSAYYQAINNLGSIKSKEGKSNEAMSLYNRALIIKENDPYIRTNIAEEFVKQNKKKDAIDLYGKILNVNPDFPMALRNLGSLLLDTRKTEGIQLLEKSARQNYYDAEWLATIADIYLMKGFFNKARVYYKQATETKTGTTNPVIYNNLGVANASLGFKKEALINFSTALRFNPNYEAAKTNYMKASIQ